jgi:hypothetical protein
VERLKQAVGRRIIEWAGHQWIEEAKPGCPYNSPLNPVTKVSGGVVTFDDIRLCLDARELNKRTVKYEYPVPRIDEIIASMI